MRSAQQMHLASSRAKFARDALCDLPADAPAEERQAAQQRVNQAEQAFASAVQDVLREKGFRS